MTIHLTQMAADNRPASRNAESLGKPLYQQKPTIANQLAGLIIAVLMAVAGGVLCWLPIREYRKFGGHLPVFHERNMSWVTAALLCALGIGLIVGGVILWRRIWSMFSFAAFQELQDVVGRRLPAGCGEGEAQRVATAVWAGLHGAALLASGRLISVGGPSEERRAEAEATAVARLLIERFTEPKGPTRRRATGRS